MRRIVMSLVALVVLAGPVKAEVQVNDKTDVSLDFFVPCAAGGAGETVLVTGSLHTLVTATTNANQMSGKVQNQLHLSGLGQTTGVKYQAVGGGQQSFTQSLQNGQATFTQIVNFRLVGQGPGNNFLMHENLHITFNADGTITVFHDNFSTECK